MKNDNELIHYESDLFDCVEPGRHPRRLPQHRAETHGPVLESGKRMLESFFFLVMIRLSVIRLITKNEQDEQNFY